MAECCLKINKEEKTTLMYCKAQVKEYPILLVLNSSSSGCMILANFLKEVNIAIDHPFIVVMIGVHEEQKQPLEEVDKFPVTVGEKTITSQVVIMDAENYAIIVENNWMKKAREPEEDVSTLEEETESKIDKSNSEEEYEDEVLIDKPYLY
ncbi:5059_t:CDS:2 [Gigaspora margarita]|uniref:5059_t:CDS:1 n=1 Tax=Gigaspora margarita TaxID=4874 RepID=A0ABN7W027_GIGMA|nr:5059_t:CDS:2 [Gigaspora margarita]